MNEEGKLCDGCGSRDAAEVALPMKLHFLFERVLQRTLRDGIEAKYLYMSLLADSGSCQ
jgi:hypothetical protein